MMMRGPFPATARGARNLALPLLGAALLLAAPTVSATDFVIDETLPSGGDCPYFGEWFYALDACVVRDTELGPTDNLLIAANTTLLVDGSFRNLGTIDNRHVIEYELGTFVNHGLVVNADSAIRRPDGRDRPHARLAPPLPRTERDPVMLVDNYGTIEGGFFRGFALEAGVCPPLGATEGGLQTLETRFEDRAEVVRNMPGGVIRNVAKCGGADFVNWGELRIRWREGGGNIQNEPGGVVFIDGTTENIWGTQTNKGVMVLERRPSGSQEEYALFGALVNEAGGLLEIRGDLRIRDDGGEGVIENHGTLLNFASVSCLGGPVYNYGTISDSGGTCSTNLGGGVIYNCLAGHPNPEDIDGDRVCNAVDCAPDDGTSWSVPTEVRDLRVEPSLLSEVQLSWTRPAYLGGSAVLYDVLGSLDAGDYAGTGTCLVSGVPALSSVDDTPLQDGELLSYLVRAVGCVDGTAGTDSSGAARAVPTCP